MVVMVDMVAFTGLLKSSCGPRLAKVKLVGGQPKVQGGGLGLGSLGAKVQGGGIGGGSWNIGPSKVHDGDRVCVYPALFIMTIPEH